MFFKKIYVAFINSFKGIYQALKKEFAFRVEFFLSLFFIPASFFIGENALEIILLSASTLLILIVELLNTAIETTLNRVSLEEHDLTRYAKDMGSGAVLISLLLWLVTWSLIAIY
ncbi:MAG: diacylglycerol kinase [SAR86 cluster bacterium]|jgi:diacylglycerol kinase (ATP)|nr:diacylglycerol kinase [SAR86 cluster bacterium]